MKKANDASPNRALKHERLLHCWSQLDVADRIGTTAFNVSRWERGITFPGSYFRQQLCSIFEKSPQDLGFLNADDEPDLAEQQAESEEAHTLAVTSESRGNTEPEDHPPIEAFPAASETLPSVWNVPYRHNPFFTGREETLQALHTAFHASNPASAQQAVALSGLGGIGKTQTAAEYAYRYRNEYQAVLWVRADTRELLITDLADIAALLTLPEKNDQDQSRAVTAVKRWLSRQTGWLLVLDNADDLAMVSEFIPEVLGGHLLLTTRAQSTGQIAQRMPMEKLSMDEGILFLLRRAKLLTSTVPLDTTEYDSWIKAKAIAEIMDGLPLALDQAAAYIEETGCGLAGYVERYQKRRIALLHRRGGLRPDHPESLVATWSLAFEKIAQAHPSVAELLRLCAFLHPDAITEDLIESASELTPHLHLLATDPFELDSAIGMLSTFSLLHRDPERHILVLHRLVQTVLREQMHEETQRLWAERAVQVVDRAFPAVNFTTWQRCQQYLPHALTCAEFIERWHLSSPAALSLLNKAGSYLRERAQYGEAERLLTNALTLSEAAVPVDEQMLAEIVNSLGVLAYDQGKYLRAEALLQRALAAYQQIWGTEHLVVAQCLSHLAENYRVQDKRGQMEVLARQALAIREKALGDDHPDVANSLHQLAMCYHGQGKYSQAEPLYQRALKIRQRALGPEHIDVAENLNNLASLYDSQGKYSQAEPLYQQALAFCEKNLGAYHMYTAVSLANLAEIYRAQGEYGRAEQLHQRALEICEQTLGPEHPHTGKSLNWLAEIYLTQHNYTECAELALRALKNFEQALGPEHNRVAISLDTLARLRRAQGALDEAETLATRAVTIFQKIWGNDTHVAGSLNTLAEILYDQKLYDRATELLQQALQIQEQTLGSEHPQVARSLYNLAVLAVTPHGDYRKAMDYFSRVLAIRRAALLPHHPDLIAATQQYTEVVQRMNHSSEPLFLEETNETKYTAGKVVLLDNIQLSGVYDH